VLPLRAGSVRHWASSLGLYAGAVAPVGLVLILRASPFMTDLVLDALAWGGAALACGAAVQMGRQSRIDRALTWGYVSQLGGLLIAVALGSVHVVAALVAVHAAALVGVVIAVDGVREAAVTWELRDLGGLRSRRALGAGLMLCALGLGGLPPLGGYYAMREGFALAHLAASSWAVVPAWWIAQLLVTCCVFRIVFFAWRGRGRVRATAWSGAVAAPLGLALASLVLSKPALGLGVWGGRVSGELLSPAAGVAVAGLCALALFVAWDETNRRRRNSGTPTPSAFAWLDAYSPQRRIVQPLLRLALRWSALDRRMFEDAPARALKGLSGLRGRTPSGEASKAPDPTAVTAAGRPLGAVIDTVLLIVFVALAWLFVTGV
jgi:hypothetical protein